MKNRSNPLFPVFFKLEELPVLVIGGGNVALEKLTALFRHAPGALVRLVATTISEPVRVFLLERNITFNERPFDCADLDGIRVALIAVNDPAQSVVMRDHCRARNVLVNVADKPALCDFYLGAVVTKGQLKIGISTNGKSPTLAKRIKETLNDAIPEEIDDLLEELSALRASLKGDFQSKVDTLNTITSSWKSTQ